MSTPSSVLLLGGVRAGKSARALTLAESAPAACHIFVATAQAFDEEMARRIAAHRAERDARWHTIEASADIVTPLAAALSARPHASDEATVVLLDCITLWVSNLLLALDTMDDAEQHIARRAAELVQLMQTHADVRWVLVSNEVGLGVVPPTPLGRAYRDALGRANQLRAAAVDRVELMVAGLSLRLK